jgi:hypothetical protein
MLASFGVNQKNFFLPWAFFLFYASTETLRSPKSERPEKTLTEKYCLQIEATQIPQAQNNSSDDSGVRSPKNNEGSLKLDKPKLFI